MSRNMDYIIYINSFVDYKTYFSYGEVQQAIAAGKLFPDPPEYRPKFTCKYCGKEIIRVQPFDSTDFCNASCASKYIYREKHAVHSYKKPSTPKRSRKYQERIMAIIPHYNQGKSDHEISHILGLCERYISQLRRYYGIPANYGRIPRHAVDPAALHIT